MELLEYYQLVNKALQGDKEAQKKWGECQVEMIPKHIAFHSKKKSSMGKASKKASAADKVKSSAEVKKAAKAAKKAEKEAKKAKRADYLA